MISMQKNLPMSDSMQETRDFKGSPHWHAELKSNIDQIADGTSMHHCTIDTQPGSPHSEPLLYPKVQI